jgi:hypothetical protein
MTDHIMVGQVIALRYVVSYQILLKSARSQQGLRLAFFFIFHLLQNSRYSYCSIGTLASFAVLEMALQPLNAFTINNYRTYTDTSMLPPQGMYNTSTGLWLHALWWQQATALETTIDYSLWSFLAAFQRPTSY